MMVSLRACHINPKGSRQTVLIASVECEGIEKIRWARPDLNWGLTAPSRQV